VSTLLIRVVQRFMDVRVMGLAAEMTYYALLSLLPLTAAMGTSLGFLERIVGPEHAQRAEDTILRAMKAVFGSEAMSDTIAPLVRGLLQQERSAFAIGSFVVSLFFASIIFRSAINCLDEAYRVDEGRGTVSLWARGLVLAVFSVVVATTMLSLLVVGPLLGGGRAIAYRLGIGREFEVFWFIARWPVVLAIAAAFLVLLYHFGPNVKATWKESLPGAILGLAALVMIAVGFRVYIEATGLKVPEIQNAQDAVTIALQVVGVLMAGLLYLWLSNMAVLTGGVLNAEMRLLIRNAAQMKWSDANRRNSQHYRSRRG
jgi:membrane protein